MIYNKCLILAKSSYLCISRRRGHDMQFRQWIRAYHIFQIKLKNKTDQENLIRVDNNLSNKDNLYMNKINIIWKEYRLQ